MEDVGRFNHGVGSRSWFSETIHDLSFVNPPVAESSVQGGFDSVGGEGVGELDDG